MSIHAKLALLTTLALLALSGTASAAQFRAEEYPATVSAMQVTITEIETETGVAKCSSYSAQAVATGPESSLALAPTLSSCKLAGQKATVAANGCKLVHHSTNEAAPFVGTLDVSCEPGSGGISIAKEGCTVTLPPQSSLGGVSFQNEGVGDTRTIRISENVTGLRYTEAGATCAAAGEHTTGVLRGSQSVSGASEHKVGVYVGVSQEVAPHTFRAEKYPALIDGTSTGSPEISVKAASIKCTGLHASGQLNAATADVAVYPEYSGCKAFGTNVTWVTEGCRFVLHSNGIGAGGFGIACSAGHEIEVRISGLACNIKIPAQEHSGGVTLTNLGSGSTRTIQAVLSVSDLQYVEPAGGGCASPGTHLDGKLSGQLSLRGYESLGGITGPQQGIWTE